MKMMKIIRGLLLMLVMKLSDAEQRCPHPPTFSATELTLKEFQDGSGSPMFYRYMTLDESKTYIYVGAMDRVYRLNTYDISTSWLRSRELPSRPDDKSLCDLKRPSTKDQECRNHIRCISLDQGYLRVCGTGAFSPMTFELDVTSLEPNGQYPPSTRNTGNLICPFDPADSYSLLYSKRGNPGSGSALYAGTILRVYQTDYVIARPTVNDTYNSVRTDRTNTFWLNEVEFISTFETDTYVYFFLNEVASELSDCKKGIKTRVSTVARICKTDTGGSMSILPSVWTTFVKARLNCSLNGADQFRELRDIQKYNNQYYGLFWRENGYANGSAVCVFTQQDIDKAFDGSFQEYANKKWVEVPPERVPVLKINSTTIRPGQCYPSGWLPSDNMQYFIKSHSLMHSAVQPTSAQPMFHFNNIFYVKLLVDAYYYQQNYFIIFYMPVSQNGQGEIHKFVKDNFSDKSKIVAKWKVYDASQPIWKMLLTNDNLYMSTDYKVLQIPVKQCVFPTCTDCVQDPHCGWDSASKSCQVFSSASGLLQSVFGDPLDVCTCQTRAMTSHTFNSPGDTVLLSCSDDLCCPSAGINWTYNNQPITWQDGKYIMTSNGALIIRNITGSDEGVYRCYSKNILFEAHSISLPGDKCKYVPTIDKLNDTLQDIYLNWWNDMHEYGDEYNHWFNSKQNVVTTNGGSCPSQAIPSCSSQP